MDFILVFLQSDQPPTAHPHGKNDNHATKYATNKSRSPPTSTDGNAYASTGAHDKQNREHEMCAPGHVLQVPSENRKKSENFYRE